MVILFSRFSFRELLDFGSPSASERTPQKSTDTKMSLTSITFFTYNLIFKIIALVEIRAMIRNGFVANNKCIEHQTPQLSVLFLRSFQEKPINIWNTVRSLLPQHNFYWKLFS